MDGRTDNPNYSSIILQVFPKVECLVAELLSNSDGNSGLT